MVQSVLTTTMSRICTLSVRITPTRIDLATFVQFDVVPQVHVASCACGASGTDMVKQREQCRERPERLHHGCAGWEGVFRGANK